MESHLENSALTFCRLSKQSKRASVLLSDVLAVLAPPAPSASHTGAGKRRPLNASSPSHTTLDAVFLDPVTGTGDGAASVRSRSLLDEEDGFGVGDVMRPQIKAGTPMASNEGQQKDDRDEWNW